MSIKIIKLLIIEILLKIVASAKQMHANQAPMSEDQPELPNHLHTYKPTTSLLNMRTPLVQNSTKYPINQYISYQALSPNQKTSILQVSTLKEPNFYHDVVLYEEWCNAMKIEPKAMNTNQTWSIVPLPKDKNFIGSRWAYKIKHKADESIKRYKSMPCCKMLHPTIRT